MDSVRQTVGVLGWYWPGVDNLGERCYQMVLTDYAKKIGVNVVFSNDPSKIDPGSPLLICGGELIADYWGDVFRDAFYQTESIVGISLSGQSAWVLSMLRAARKIWVRDYLTLKAAQEAGCNAAYAPDISCLCKGDPDMGLQLVQEWFREEQLEPPSQYLLLFPLGYWAMKDEPLNHCALSLYADIVRQSEMPCVLAAASTRNPDDRAACYLIREWSGQWKKTIVARPGSLIDIIAGAAGVISSRLHGALVAAAHEKPFVAWSDHGKVVGAIEALGYPFQRLPCSTTPKEILTALSRCSPQPSEPMRQQAQQSLMEAFTMLI